MFNKNTIVSLSSGTNVSAIAIIRISGGKSFYIVGQLFKSKSLEEENTHTLHFGTLKDKHNQVIDEVIIAIYKKPHSFTGEDMIEINCHGSPYIIQKILESVIELGAKAAMPGEFSQRAFLNGKIDLAQAEGIADLIASNSEASHKVAINQMRGDFSRMIKNLREKIINFASLLELELDFSEEDVEFANRTELNQYLAEVTMTIQNLLKSFKLGNVLKNGIPIVIIGKPNTGKSTLLNALLGEERAIVSNIPGTTRDFIEDQKIIKGVNIRFIDTAGLRDTEDSIEKIGIARTMQKIKEASLLLYLFDLQSTPIPQIKAEVEDLAQYNIPILLVGNKSDQVKSKDLNAFMNFENFIEISALKKQNLDLLEDKIFEVLNLNIEEANNIVITNLRHYEALFQSQLALESVKNALSQNYSTEMVASDLRTVLDHLGSITGQISYEDLLTNIFSKFCIGK